LSVEAITTEPEEKQKQYLHPASNGIIVIDDINTVKYPRGVRMKGKYDFIPINEIGEDVLTNSAIFRSLLKAKKIEIVDEEYVKKNLHKTMRKISPADAALDKILVPSGVRAEAVAENGGLDTSEDQGNISVRIEI
jgi:hypothetical protein